MTDSELEKTSNFLLSVINYTVLANNLHLDKVNWTSTREEARTFAINVSF